MQHIYADLHIHIGRAGGKPVKITASKELDLKEIMKAARIKGLNMVGVVDCGSPLVTTEIQILLEQSFLQVGEDGTLKSQDGITLILGAEIESREGAHFITYLPDLPAADKWQKVVSRKVHNLNLSTQKTILTAAELVDIAEAVNGMFVVAHAFTPHKGAYGCWVTRLADGLRNRIAWVKALELGLSSDTDMAGLIHETRQFTFLANSDAHSAGNIAREYNLIRMQSPTFQEFRMAVEGTDGRRVMANFGMDPLLGKYHRSYCPACNIITDSDTPIFQCDSCGAKMVAGVWDRVMTIRDFDQPQQPVGRARYYYRVPLRFIPGLGPKTLTKLRNTVGTDIDITERADLDLIKKAAGERVTGYIKTMRESRLEIVPGGGGKYGRVKENRTDN
ncbi:MAG: endonuclease Q family protein [Chitinophagales bacterium]